LPIKNLTEKRLLPRLGKIHLGIKKATAAGVEYPAAVDYLVCPPEVQKVFGEKPRELRILIPVEDEEKWCSQYYRLYARTRGLLCKGDGEKAIRLVVSATKALPDRDTKLDEKTEMIEFPCKGRDCPEYKLPACKEVMNLQFLLPEVPGIGIWQIDTGSINTIKNINSMAELIKKLYGRISMIPLMLTIEPQEIHLPDTGVKKTVYILNLRTRDTLAGLMATARKPIDRILLETGTGEIINPEQVSASEMPVSDDEYPELILPADQAPKGEKPLPKDYQVDTDFDALRSATATKATAGIVGVRGTPERKVEPPKKLAATVHGRDLWTALKAVDLPQEVFKKEFLQPVYKTEKVVGVLTVKQVQELIDRLELCKVEKLTGLAALKELQKLGVS